MGYNGDPSVSPIDAVRFLIGDTDNAALYLTDGEIQFLLNLYDGNAGRAAIDAVYGIIAKLSGSQDETVGSVSLSNTQALQGFKDLLSALQRKFVSSANGRVYAGGISRAAKSAIRSNPDRVLPSFSRDDPAGGSIWAKSLGDWEYGP